MTSDEQSTSEETTETAADQGSETSQEYSELEETSENENQEETEVDADAKTEPGSIKAPRDKTKLFKLLLWATSLVSMILGVISSQQVDINSVHELGLLEVL